ncbi:hypothetical protein BS47DRAFT_285126 [Hydnum rufescens UP504]|uniref:Uncharacterized protein n=1 Tax=Hydnum rufescens UP504 TaxID=1448309 RepID=A0A9P6AKW7_9AGAM|nr:hypothetical protein BS47DRAFT_285126 [Hydnum rufescens UP504]
MNGRRLRHHWRPKELQTRRIPQRIRLRRHPILSLYPLLSPSPYPHSSLSPHRPSSVSVSQSSPSSFASRICTKFICLFFALFDTFFVRQSFSISLEWLAAQRCPSSPSHTEYTRGCFAPATLAYQFCWIWGVSSVNRRDSPH